MLTETAVGPRVLRARLLSVAEWPAKLAGTELEAVWPHLDPLRAIVLAVEDGDRLVACWALFAQWHVEGLWIAPEHRGKGGVARRLWRLLKQTAARLGIRTVATAACSDEIRTLLAHAGAAQLPGDHYVLTVGA